MLANVAASHDGEEKMDQTVTALKHFLRRTYAWLAGNQDRHSQSTNQFSRFCLMSFLSFCLSLSVLAVQNIY